MSEENPKHIQAMKDGKAPLDYLITSVEDCDAEVLKGGALKYGRRNWLIDKITASTYVAAVRRHFNAWADGQDLDPESGFNHLYHVRACCAIVLDAKKNSMLIDDRKFAESISADKDAKVEEAKSEPLCIVQYTDTQPNADKVMLTRVKTFGPFAGYSEAMDFIRLNSGKINGATTFKTLTPPPQLQEQENARNRTKETERRSDAADGDYTSKPNRNELAAGSVHIHKGNPSK